MWFRKELLGNDIGQLGDAESRLELIWLKKLDRLSLSNLIFYIGLSSSVQNSQFLNNIAQAVLLKDDNHWDLLNRCNNKNIVLIETNFLY